MSSRPLNLMSPHPSGPVVEIVDLGDWDVFAVCSPCTSSLFDHARGGNCFVSHVCVVCVSIAVALILVFDFSFGWFARCA